MSLSRSQQNCLRKVHYRTEAQALRRAARLAGRRRFRSLRAYRCPHCGQWHLTHQERRRG